MTYSGRAIAGLWMLVCSGVAAGADVSYTHHAQLGQQGAAH
jgi:hypothetical protein